MTLQSNCLSLEWDPSQPSLFWLEMELKLELYTILLGAWLVGGGYKNKINPISYGGASDPLSLVQMIIMLDFA